MTKAKCDFCNKAKEITNITIRYEGNETFGFDVHHITFQLCAQCVGENITIQNGVAKVVA
jgi:hypothetical protein